MPEKPTFVVNDRRKFTAEGELRPDLAQETHQEDAEKASEQRSAAVPEQESQGMEGTKGPQLVASEPTGATAEHAGSAADLSAELADLPEAAAAGSLYGEGAGTPQDGAEHFSDDALPPGPTEEQAAEATRAYDATVDRLDLAMRAANPGGERMPEMTFERLVQSLYTQALLLLGGGAEPGETPRVDILGARQTIDMLAVIDSKTKGNLSDSEDKLLQSALFDLRMGFLEITQALARQAAHRQGGVPGGPAGAGAGPRIVR